MEVDPISWSEAAQRSGPFFFAILYAVVLTGWAAKNWREARKDPNANEADRRTHRLYFIFTASFGALAVVLACILWIERQPPVVKSYTMRGVIQQLRSGQDLWSEDLYFRRRFGPAVVVAAKLDQPFDVTFFAEQDHPFAAPQAFEIHFKKEGAESWEPIVASLEAGRKYRIRYDPASDANVIVLIGAPPPPQPSLGWLPKLIDEAWAAPLPPSPQPSSRQPLVANDAVRAEITRALQATRLYTGAQIDAVDKLARFSKSDRLAFIKSEGPFEPMIVTLLDLTRHEDDELSYKAKALIKGVDVEETFRRKLLDPKTDRLYRDALLRLESVTAKWITDSRVGRPQAVAPPMDVSSIYQRELTRKSFALVTASWAVKGKTPRLLSASSASSGDHFWISSTPPAGNTRAADCTAWSMRHLSDLVVDETRHLTWSYSKKAILAAADAIEKCGAKPTFARPSTLSAAVR